MNNNKRRFGISMVVALTATGLSTSALANDGYILAGIFKALRCPIERNTGDAANPSITSFAEETDAGLGLHLEYKHHLNSDTFVAAELFYTDENTSTTNINNMLQTIVDLNSTYGINVKAGFDVTDKYSLYGIVGATALDLDLHNSYPFAPPMRNGSASEVGLALGAGFEFALDNNWSVKGEYSRINDVDFTPLPEAAVPGKLIQMN